MFFDEPQAENIAIITQQAKIKVVLSLISQGSCFEEWFFDVGFSISALVKARGTCVYGVIVANMLVCLERGWLKGCWSPHRYAA